MSKIITDEQELNTATGELVTEDYALEILGLQSIADFRKFSRSFMKLSKIVKGIENSNNNKLDKGAVSSEYDTAKKIEDKIKGIDEKFKNFCPFPVGSVLQMWNETNPTSLYLGTTWELISAGKYVKTGDRALQTGGSNSISIQKANLPNIKLKIDSFSLITQPHNHSVPQISGYSDNPDQAHANRTALGAYNGRNARDIYTNNTASSTNTASLNTESLGNGTALSIQPEYITLKYWKRTS